MPRERTCGDRSLYLVKGSDPLLRDRVVDELVVELLGDDDRSLALEDITIPGRAGAGDDPDAASGAEGRDAAIAALLNAVTSPPFMTERRIVVMRDAGALAAGDAQRIIQYLDDPLDTTALVIVAGGGTIPAALVKKLKEIGRRRARTGEREDHRRARRPRAGGERPAEARRGQARGCPLG